MTSHNTAVPDVHNDAITVASWSPVDGTCDRYRSWVVVVGVYGTTAPVHLHVFVVGSDADALNAVFDPNDGNVPAVPGWSDIACPSTSPDAIDPADDPSSHGQ